MTLTPQEREYLLRKLRSIETGLIHHRKMQINPCKSTKERYKNELELISELTIKISEHQPEKV